ncbi:hypothetical protein SAMN05444277_110146 [Parafilimonas terrae]|jgi:hypothetical protein|uniref:Uncharacterized protein n=1 Tax=Parafilimonas terrae TaxID=1465490 RepID=A0A1I5Y3T7_9BACT|nr:hypothetical protein SAMN05444277_110146 [Parafilimonas terrae]
MFVAKIKRRIQHDALKTFSIFYRRLLTLIPKFGRYACIYYGGHSWRMDAMLYQA